MKNLLLALLLLISTFTQAQTWRGIRIGSQFETVRLQLVKLGYVEKARAETFSAFTIDNRDDNKVFVYKNPETKVVYMLVTNVTKSNTWRTLKSKYDDMDRILSQKYTKVDFAESYAYPYETPNNDFERIMALKTDRASIFRKYVDAHGKEILLNIIGSSDDCYVNISYIDGDLWNDNKRVEEEQLKSQY